MFGLRSMKEIKKKLKRKRRPVWSLGMLAALFLAASAAGIGGAAIIRQAAFVSVPVEPAAAADPVVPSTDKPAAGSREEALSALAGWRSEVEIELHRIYWCGEETRMLGRHTAAEAAELIKSRLDWEARFDPAGRIVVEETSNDLAPACRDTAYIGMDSDGNLSLFDGPPRKDNVIRTFFQMDVQSLESSLSKERLHELAGGIRISDKDEFNSVLSTFTDFAARRSKGVMKSNG